MLETRLYRINAKHDTAFDPIFYLHHCNVDRILAFWEHIYPDYGPGDDGYLDANGKTRRQFSEFRRICSIVMLIARVLAQSGGSWVEIPNQVVNGSTDLVPFRMDDGIYWSPKSARSLTDESKPKCAYQLAVATVSVLIRSKTTPTHLLTVWCLVRIYLPSKEIISGRSFNDTLGSTPSRIENPPHLSSTDSSQASRSILYLTGSNQ